MTVQELKALKKELGYSNAKLSEESGVPLGTVNKVMAGMTEAPRFETLRALEKILLEEKEKRDRYANRTVEERYQAAPSYSLLHDEAVAYGVPMDKGPGEYTIEDYYNLPDDHRVELIDGVFYDMAAPSIKHQSICVNLMFQLKLYVHSKKGTCQVFAAPTDVQPSAKDDKTIIQPDVLVVCDKEKFTEKRVIGAPDFVAEILSPSTRMKDCTRKLAKYSETGVREYWIVDPDRERVIVYLLKEDLIPKVYTFDDKIPVDIYNGELEIDFRL